ncbi:hypothetical protein QOM21_35740 [Streptomyces sp. Pv4-95]|uniref:hypothetical protein n=1 Tax=Streptomyces sp. Pv4-95 TaxID=3049543 RepID=UPI003891486F
MAGNRLKNGNTTIDRRLDRIPQFDERSRNFPIREMVTERAPLRSAGWACPSWLDQGNEGACVGFAWSHELIATPVEVPGVNDSFARGVYREAQKVDEWPGEDYDGTSVLAGAKAVSARGYMDEYRWAFGVDDVLRTLGYFGPVVIGIKWYNSMFQPAPNGLLEVSPGDFGGHAILVRGVSLKARLNGSRGTTPVVRLRNSWGRDWGVDGDCYLRVEDLEKLLKDDGEACVPVERKASSSRAPHVDSELLRESGEID